MDAEINAAVEWWTNALRTVTYPDLGRGAEDAALFLGVARTMVKPVTEEQLAQFGAELRSRLRVRLEDPLNGWREAKERGNPWRGAAFRILAVDYHPGDDLREAAEAAGIHSLHFPPKTTMWVNPGEVRVAAGYGAAGAVIYPPQD